MSVIITLLVHCDSVAIMVVIVMAFVEKKLGMGLKEKSVLRSYQLRSKDRGIKARKSPSIQPSVMAYT